MIRILWSKLEPALDGSAELNHPGFCLACGSEAYSSASGGTKCESCKAKMVYGAQEILMMGAFEYDKPE